MGDVSNWGNDRLSSEHICSVVTSQPEVALDDAVVGLGVRNSDTDKAEFSAGVHIVRKWGETHRLKALLLLAPAPDFTHELMKPELSDDQKAQLETLGYMEEPSEYSSDPNIFTKALFDDGDTNRVMTGMIETGCPVHILQGMQDPDVPYKHAMKLVNFLPNEQVSMTLIKDGDHRLSRDEDIALLIRTVEALVA